MSKRKEKDWISFEKLCTMVADILNAVKFLHSRDIVHRAFTASSFSVKEDGSVICQILPLHQMVISEFIAGTRKLIITYWIKKFFKDFELLHIFLHVSECTRISLRWSAPESILYDKYSKESDVYMVGQLLYQLFTHGCYPYTELYGHSLDRVLELVRYILVSLISFLSNLK